jgi:hypothetical protein
MVKTQHREQNHGKSGKAKDEHIWNGEQTFMERGTKLPWLLWLHM